MNEILEVLIITGPCGIGKTTTAIEWAKTKDGARIDCDYLTEWIHQKNFPKWGPIEEKFVSDLSVVMAFEYLKNGMSVAIENVWSPKAIEELRGELFRMRGLNVKAVRLKCELEENQKRDAERIPENQMKERVGIVAKELDEYKWPSYIHEIDTTNMSVDEVIQRIESLD